VVAVANLGLNAALDFVLYRVGVWGIPLSTAAVNVAGTTVLLVLLRRRVGPMDIAATASATLRIVAASVVLAATAYPIWRVLDDALGRAWPAQVVSLGAALVIGGGLYLAACRALRVREIDALLSLRGRLRRS
jgi:peptidoglycan biosynthesis protein MviN/MurJ (putative lipid II flippase)